MMPANLLTQLAFLAIIKTTLAAKLSGERFEVLPPGGSYWLGFEDYGERGNSEL